jgi:hypothetical protein
VNLPTLWYLVQARDSVSLSVRVNVSVSGRHTRKRFPTIVTGKSSTLTKLPAQTCRRTWRPRQYAFGLLNQVAETGGSL